MPADLPSYGIPDIVERLRADLRESQRRLAERRRSVVELPHVKAFMERQAEIADATFGHPQRTPPPPLPRPLELAELDVPLELESVTIEIEYAVVVNDAGGLDLQVVTADRARERTHTNKLTLVVKTPNPLQIGG